MTVDVYKHTPLSISSVIAVGIYFFGQSSALAHHSANAGYEMDYIEIAGELTEVRWISPHIRMTLRVTEDGKTEDWLLEGPPSVGVRGLPPGVIEVGDTIRVAGRPARRGRKAMFANNILLEDDREIVFRGAPYFTDNTIGESDLSESVAQRAQRAERDDASSGIFGVWFSYPGFDGDVEGGIWGGDIELTGEAAAIRDQYDPSAADNPFISCTRGIPEIMVGFGPLEFTDQGDQILLRFGEFDIARPIMMGPDAEAKRPPKSATRPYGDVGYAAGYWEDENTLVVRTTGMNFPYYDQSGLRQSPDGEIVERWTLTDGGSALEYELTVIDPATFIKPVIQTRTWYWAPDRTVQPYNCVQEPPSSQVIAR